MSWLVKLSNWAFPERLNRVSPFNLTSTLSLGFIAAETSKLLTDWNGVLRVNLKDLASMSKESWLASLEDSWLELNSMEAVSLLGKLLSRTASRETLLQLQCTEIS